MTLSCDPYSDCNYADCTDCSDNGYFDARTQLFVLTVTMSEDEKSRKIRQCDNCFVVDQTRSFCKTAFVEASKFVGTREGFGYKHGSQGNGYYAVPDATQQAPEPGFDILWSKHY